MKELKPLDYAILYELMKNSKVSDRQLAKKLGVSQPTVTRRRARLEEEAIDGYTAIPRWERLGYQILAVTLVKAPLKAGSQDAMKETIENATQWLKKQPTILFGGECRGMGTTGIMVSIHKDYAALDEFLTSHRQKLGHLLEEVNTIIVNLAGKGIYRPFHLKYLAETQAQKESKVQP